MEVTHYQDPVTGDLYREIREKTGHYTSLQELKEAYEKRGKKAWLTFDCDLRTDYCLTIKL